MFCRKHWIDGTLNFLVVASRGMRARAQLPDGWRVGGPEALLEAASQLEPGAFTVYALDRATDEGEMRFGQVTGIWHERVSSVGWLPMAHARAKQG